MCVMCDGGDLDDLLFGIDWLVHRDGYALMPVMSDEAGGWAYTIGLAARGHSELVVAGIALCCASEVLAGLASRVLGGESLDESEVFPCGDGLTGRLVDVHAAQVRRGLVNVWLEYYAGVGSPAPSLRVRQVVLSGPALGEGRGGAQPRLDRPADALGLARPTPTDRRAAQRRARRRRG